MSSIIALQWSLDSTSTSTISIARDLVRAATSDNISMLALAAVEKFGATLAICPDTCHKIHRIIERTPKPVFIEFAKATIGFSSGDSAAYLSKSQAGLQFLALAAMLVGTIGEFKGSLALEIMLRDTSSDRTMLPPAQHLQTLLGSLQGRLLQSRFADRVIYWKSFLIMQLPPPPGHDPQKYSKGYWGTEEAPNAEGISSLVDAMRQLSRIGSAISVSITAGYCMPWVIAFTQFCLGGTPIIIINGAQVLNPTTTRVSITYNEDIPFRLRIFRDLDSPADLVEATTESRAIVGMLSLKAYGNYLRLSHGFLSKERLGLLRQLLPKTIQLVLSKLRLPCRIEDQDVLNRGRAAQVLASPFPGTLFIIDVMNRLFSITERTSLFGTDNQSVFFADKSLPLIGGKFSLSEMLHDDGSTRDYLFDSVLNITKNVLLLSLFSNLDELMLRPDTTNHSDLFESHIANILCGYKPTYCQISDIQLAALNLAGHNLMKDIYFSKRLVISSSQGQTIYPSIYDTISYELPGHSFLRLSWIPGFLLHEGSTFKHGIFADGMSNLSLGISEPSAHQMVTKPLNIYPPGSILSWKVAKEDGFLVIRAEAYASSFKLENCISDALLENLSIALIPKPCSHDPETRLSPPDDSWVYEGFSMFDKTKKSCIAVSGNAALRSAAISYISHRPFVLRGRTCLACCIKLCDETGCRIIIC